MKVSIVFVLLSLLVNPMSVLAGPEEEAEVLIKNTSAQKRIYSIYWVDHPGKQSFPYLMGVGELIVGECFGLKLHSPGLYLVAWRQDTFPPLPPEKRLTDIIIGFKLKLMEDVVITCNEIKRIKKFQI